MQLYAKLLPDGSFDYMIETAGKVAFGPRHYQPVHTLTYSQRILFNVVIVADVPPPPVLQSQIAERAGAEKVDGVWQTKWSVRALSADELAAKQALATEKERSKEIALALKNDTLLAAIRSKTKAQYDTWWSARGAADKDKILKNLLLAEAQR